MLLLLRSLMLLWVLRMALRMALRTGLLMALPMVPSMALPKVRPREPVSEPRCCWLRDWRTSGKTVTLKLEDIKVAVAYLGLNPGHCPLLLN